jgi:tetratricopeptide (TPR) repeat protein
MDCTSIKDQLQRIQNAEGFHAFRMILSRELISNHRDYLPGLILYAHALVALGRYEEARDVYTEVMQHLRQDKMYSLFQQMGDMCKKMGDYESSFQWVTKAIGLRVDDADGYIGAGAILARQGRLENAEQYHRKATVCSQGCIDEAFLNLGFVLRAQERFDEAQKCFEKALELDAGYDEARIGLNDVRAVFAYLESNQRRQTKDWTPKERLWRSREAENSGSIAYPLILIRDLIEDHNEYGPAYLDYGVTLVSLSRYGDARAALEKALELCPENKLFIPTYHIGHLLELKGDFKEATEWFRRAIKLKPQNAENHGKLGHILAKQGRLDEARRCYESALECSEGDLSEIYLGLGCVLRSLEQFLKALECFEKAFELNPELEAAEVGVRDIKLVIDFLKKRGSCRNV